MVLREYLSELSLDSLRSIAEEIGIEAGAKLTGKLVNAIDLRLFDRAYLKRSVRRLKEHEQRGLMRLILAGRSGLASVDGSPEEMRGLVRRGLAYAVGWQGRPVRYVMPEDVAESLSEYARDLLRSELGFLPKEIRVRESGSALVRDLFVFLSYADQYGIALTGQGRLYKRTVRKISERLEVREEPSEARETEYPPRFGIIVRYSYGRDLVEHVEGRLQSTKLFEQWLDFSESEKVEDLLACEWSFFGQHHSPVQTTIRILSALPPRQAVPLAALLETAQRYGPVGHGGGSRFASQVRRIRAGREQALWMIQELYWLGVVGLDAAEVDRATRVALTRMGEVVLNGEASGTDEPPVAELFVQPNFEVLVPRELDLNLRFQLEHFAELVSVDQMLTYRIGRDSVYRAAERGMKSEEILSFLETYSKVPLPQNLRYSISDWAGRYGEIQFRNAFLLCTETPELADELKASQTFAPFIRGELSPSALIVHREAYPTLVERLQEAGYFPRTDIIGEQEESASRKIWRTKSSVNETFVPQRVKDVLDETDSLAPEGPFVEPSQF